MPQLYPYIQSWVDNRGNTLTFTFGTIPAANDYGRINKIQSSSGNWVIFSYNGAGVITEAAASDGRTVHYTYNIPGDLVAVRLPDGNEFSTSTASTTTWFPRTSSLRRPSPTAAFCRMSMTPRVEYRCRGPPSIRPTRT